MTTQVFSNLKVLHIADINDNKCNGINAVVPNHILEQSKIAQVCYHNVRGIDLNLRVAKLNYEDIFKLKPNQIDIVIFHGIYIMKFIYISRYLQKIGIPYIIVPHGSLTKQAQSKKKLKKIVGNFLYFNRFVSKSEAIQYLSQGEMDNTSYSKKESFIGTNGMNDNPYITHSRNGKDICISYIGRLDAYGKGLDLVFDSIAHDKSFFINHNVHFEIYGNDIKGRKAVLEKLIAQYAVNDVVFLHSEVVGKDKISVLTKSDYFILTSRSEGMPMGVLEALSYGVPCLVSEGTNLKDVIEKYDAGWTCTNNAHDVHAMLRKAIEEKHLSLAKSLNAHKLIESEFSWNKIVRETLAKYASFLIK